MGGEECTAQVMWPVWRNEWISLFKAVYASTLHIAEGLPLFTLITVSVTISLGTRKRDNTHFYILRSLTLLWYLLFLPFFKSFRNRHAWLTHALQYIHTPCVAYSYSHQNSQAWLWVLPKTVNGRSKQVASVHFSLIPLPHPPPQKTPYFYSL